MGASRLLGQSRSQQGKLRLLGRLLRSLLSPQPRAIGIVMFINHFLHMPVQPLRYAIPSPLSRSWPHLLRLHLLTKMAHNIAIAVAPAEGVHGSKEKKVKPRDFHFFFISVSTFSVN